MQVQINENQVFPQNIFSIAFPSRIRYNFNYKENFISITYSSYNKHNNLGQEKELLWVVFLALTVNFSLL